MQIVFLVLIYKISEKLEQLDNNVLNVFKNNYFCISKQMLNNEIGTLPYFRV